MAGNGEEADVKTLDAIMAETWNETMGEDQEELPEANEHLFESDEEDDVDTQDDASLDSQDAEDAPEDTEKDTPDEKEPVEELASAEEGDQENGSPETQEAPEHWSTEDRQMFANLNGEAKDFLLRRHKQMEGDYTRKTQENAEAIKVGKLLDEGMDPSVKADLARIGIDKESYLRQMMQWHHRSLTDPQGFARDMMQQLRLDPAAVFKNEPGKPPQKVDPTTQRLEAVEQHLTQEQQARYNSAVEETKQRVKNFAEEKDAEGKPLRPHFEQVRKVMAQFIQVDPNMPLQDAYEAAVFKDPELRAQVVTSTPTGGNREERTKKALRAKKANIKGRHGSSIKKPAEDKPMTLQESLAAAANEIGMN